MPPIYMFLDPGQALPQAEAPLLPVRRSYVLGTSGRLFLSREDLPGAGGLLGLVREEVSSPYLPLAAEQLGRECARRRLAGVVFPEGVSPGLAEVCLRRLTGLSLFFPEGVLPGAGAIPLVGSALSGGTLVGRLASSSPAALVVEPVAALFSLPAPDGEGTPLSPAELAALLRGRRGRYSPELCENYLTCPVEGQPRLILYDDRESVRGKLAAAEAAGAIAVFFRREDAVRFLG